MPGMIGQPSGAHLVAARRTRPRRTPPATAQIPAIQRQHERGGPGQTMATTPAAMSIRLSSR